MLAKLVSGTMDPRRAEQLTEAVESQLVPTFLAHDGADRGYWMLDPISGRMLAITMWDDLVAVRGAAASDGVQRASLADLLALRALSFQTLPVLAARSVPVIAGDGPQCRSARVTWVEGVPASRRTDLEALYRETVSDQADSSGFCGSYWFGEEESGEGCAVSMWERPADLAGGTSASRRRQRRLSKALGCRISDVHEYEVIAAAVADRADGTRRPVGVDAFTG